MDTNEAQIGLRPGVDIEGKLLGDRVVGTLSGPDVKKSTFFGWIQDELNLALGILKVERDEGPGRRGFAATHHASFAKRRYDARATEGFTPRMWG